MNANISPMQQPSKFAAFLQGPPGVPVVVMVTTLLLAAFYYWAGLIAPPQLPEAYFSSYAHMHGLTLLMILVPAYSAAAALMSFRRSRQLAELIDVQLAEKLTQIPWLMVLGAGVVGLVYAFVFNIPRPLSWENFTRFEFALISGQLLIWVLVFGLLAWRIHVSRLFNRQGQQVDIDIFELGNLRPFARIGLTDVLLIAGGMVLSTVQSLDANFRLVNYLYSVPILLPAMIFLALYPMWSIHRRIVVMKAEQLQQVNQMILQAPKDLATDNVTRLEVLLQRRERLLGLPNWPADLKTVQQFLFYLVIPPMAWLGAAVVELLLDRAVG